MATSALSGAQHGPRAQAAGLLAAAEGWRARTRAQMNGAWVSLLGFGVLSLAAVPFAWNTYNFGAHGRNLNSYPTFAYAELTGLCVVHEPGTPCLEGEFDGAVLRFLAWGVWFVLLPLAWVVFARWYRLRGEARGVVPRRGLWTRTTLVTTTAVTTALTGLLLGWSVSWEMDVLQNTYVSPWYVIGIGLLALGLAEHSWITAAAGVTHAALLTVYLGADWGTGWLPWQQPAHPRWTDGPHFKALLLAAVLLVAASAEWAAAHRRARSGAGTVAA